MSANGNGTDAGKTARKTARSPRSGAEIPLGAHPGNTGGKPGRSGRPPKAFKDFLAELRRSPKVQQALKQAAEDGESKNFKAALDVIVRYDPEAPGTKIEHSGSIALTPEERESRVAELLAGVKRRLVGNGNGHR